jgi:hypothetical protein
MNGCVAIVSNMIILAMDLTICICCSVLVDFNVVVGLAVWEVVGLPVGDSVGIDVGLLVGETVFRDNSK